MSGIVVTAQAPEAQKPKDAWPDMPTYDIFTEEELKRDFVTKRFPDPLDRPELGFSLIVPAGWEEVPATVPKDKTAKDSEGMIPLVLLKAKEPDVRIEVAHFRVAQDTDLEKWARAYLGRKKLKLVHGHRTDFSGRRVFDILVQGKGYLARMTFSRHGDGIVLVSGSAPTATYQTWARHLGVAAVSFRALK